MDGREGGREGDPGGKPGAPLLQVPARQVSAWVQALPSLHAAPSAFAGLLQVPGEATKGP